MEYIQEHPAPVQEAVREAIEDQHIQLKDEDGDGEASVNNVSAFYVDDVVDRDGSKMVLRCSAAVNLTANVCYNNPDHYMAGSIRTELKRSIDVSAEATIRWEDQADYVVEKVVLNDGNPISVNVHEGAETNWK